VLSAERPLTAYEILDLLRPKDPSATPAGVYRSLDFLTELGLVHRIKSAKSFIACAMPDHAHPSQMLVCRRCGTVVETEICGSREPRKVSGGALALPSTTTRWSSWASAHPVADEPPWEHPAHFHGNGKDTGSKSRMRY
jgi:hypothetical protein